jgi:hypothetical protein
MKKITKKDIRIINLLNDFGYLDEDFFRILFHSNSKLTRTKTVYKINIYLGKLVKKELVCICKGDLGNNYYSLSSTGKTFLLESGTPPNANNITINNGKFFHSRLCSLVYAKVASIYKIGFQSENDLFRSSDSSIVPDLAIKLNETIVYFEIERSLKSEELIKEKLSNYNSKFKDGYLVYLTEGESIIKKITRLKHAYPNYKKIFAFDLNKFMDDPIFHLAGIGSFSMNGSNNEF